MRLLIHLQPLNKISDIPIDNYPLSATVYRLLSAVAPEYATFLHDEGYAPGQEGIDEAGEEWMGAFENKRFKLFVFSRLAQRNKKIVGDRIRLNDSLVTWQIGSPIDEMMAAVAQSLVTGQEIVVGDKKSKAGFGVVGIDVAAPPSAGRVLLGETISPIFVAVSETDASGKLVKHHVRAEEDDRFAEQVASNLREKYRALTGFSPEDEELRFRFIERPRSQLVQFRGTNHKCYLGRFELRGNPELIRLAWEAGLGASNSKGFGMMTAIQH